MPDTIGDAPLTRPSHLRPAKASRRAWLVGRPWAALAAVLGLLTFIAAAVVQPTLWAAPDWRIGVPGLAATMVAAMIAIARREHAAYPLWLAGLGLAAAALVLGWFLMLAIVIGATVGLILILHALM